MTISEETLMAYADGELEPEQRAQVEAALAADPDLAKRVDQHRALRTKLHAAFDPILMESVPESLVASVYSVHAGSRNGAAEAAVNVTDLRRARAAHVPDAKLEAAARTDAKSRRWTLFEWGALAASVVAVAIVGRLALNRPEMNRIASENGRMVAQADLSRALSRQLASEQAPDAPVQIGLSFNSKSGATCRTFTVKEKDVVAGVACREGNEWVVSVLAHVPDTVGNGGYKPASVGMPPAVITAVEQQIVGDPLDAAGEAAARSRGWK